jgi:predicted O-methyltransferase YrrM
MYQNTPPDQSIASQTNSQLQTLKLFLERSQAQLRQAQSELQSSHLQVGQVREQLGELQRQVQSSQELPSRSTSQTDKEFHFLEGDYIAPGLVRIKLDFCFPHMVIGNTTECPWPFLRREIPHNWYVDTRYPLVGFINRDEAHILYNSALKFRGKRALEIGCWLGWSACHIASAGVELDVIDPMLERPEFHESVTHALKAAGVIDSVRLIPGYSPEKVEELSSEGSRKWSFIFIDGNHDASGPLNDAKLCEQLAEEDALILFHDLVAPDVAAGLEYLAKKGWNVMLYQTMQVMGVAWRGNIEPVFHQPDPSICWQIPHHLQHYPGNLGLQVNQDSLQLEQTLKRCQAELDWLRLKLQSTQIQSSQSWEAKEWNVAELAKARSELMQLQQSFEQIQGEFNLLQAELVQVQDELRQAQAKLTRMQHESAQSQAQLHTAQEALALLQPRLAESESSLIQVQSKLLATQDELEQSRFQARQSSSELSNTTSQVADQAKALQETQVTVKQLNNRILAMQSSKFWQLRVLWVKLKQRIGLRGE